MATLMFTCLLLPSFLKCIVTTNVQISIYNFVNNNVSWFNVYI